MNELKFVQNFVALLREVLDALKISNSKGVEQIVDGFLGGLLEPENGDESVIITIFPNQMASVMHSRIKVLMSATKYWIPMMISRFRCR